MPPLTIPKKYFMMATNACNCICEYCFAPNKGSIMGDEVLEKSTDEIFRNGDSPLFMWYGGEPFLAGLRFFEKAVALQGERKKTNLVQSSLSVQNNELNDFMIENNFVISASIDGPEKIHNQKRKFRSGKGNHKAIMENVKYFQDRGVDPWAICVVSDHNVHSPEEVYQFFKVGRLKVRFCPEIEQRGFSNDDYLTFMRSIHNLWGNDQDKVHISNFNKLLTSIRTEKPQECDNMSNCLENNLCIDSGGDVYPCNRFVGMEDFNLGNILSKGLEKILDSKKAKELASRGMYLGCSCDEAELLNGGCMYNAQIRTGSWKNVDPYCDATRNLIRMLRVKDE